jgi:beta-lactamase superfamily II metal-dependent hydrolase
MNVDFVSVDEAPVLTASGGRTGVSLLWGDRVDVVGTAGSLVQIRSGRYFGTGHVARAHLGGRSLLEFYFIDVGQGDGVLVRTPDHRHVLIDAGFSRRRQMTGKNAADFVDWKFVKDYRRQTIALDAVIASHNDADHFGGLWDLLSSDPAAKKELDAKSVTVEAFYHAGLSWWKQGSGRTLGPSVKTDSGAMWTRLLGDRASVQAALAGGGAPQLAGEWAQFLSCVLDAKTAGGQPTPVRRLSHADHYLPGFEPAAGAPAVRVIAPVEFGVGGEPALRRFSGGDDKNTNGQSILLRVDYGRARVLLTGDLNRAAQAALLQDYAGAVQEFECDVAKACHHGSDDVSYRFLQAMRPAVTVISSGDNEGHDHPRPGIVAASATTGFLTLDGDSIATPLVYSTELARSLKLARATGLTVTGRDAAPLVLKREALGRASVTLPKKSGGKREPTRTLDRARIVSDLVYGLVNVRTDGERILCATRNEADYSWQVQTLHSRF